MYPLSEWFPVQEAWTLLVECLLKSVGVLAVAGLAVLMLGRASAAVKHLVWLFAVLALAALPILTLALPGWSLLPSWNQLSEPVVEATDADPDSTEQMEAVSPQPLSSDRFPEQRSSPQPSSLPAGSSGSTPPSGDADQEVAPASNPTSLPWRQLLIWGWSGGAGLRLMGMAVGLISVALLGRRARPLSDERVRTTLDRLRDRLGVYWRVRLLEGRSDAMPMTWSGLPGARSKLLLPSEAKKWDDARLEAVLLHELAHVKRRDCLTQALSQLVACFYWPNPLIWIALWRLRLERERACDDLVLASGHRASDYAEQLLAVATSLRPSVLGPGAAIAMAKRVGVEGRVMAILDQKRSRRAVSGLAVAITAALLAAVAVPVAMLEAASDNHIENFDFRDPPSGYEKGIRAADRKHALRTGDLRFQLSELERTEEDALEASLGINKGYEVVEFRLFDHASRKLIHSSKWQVRRDAPEEFNIHRLKQSDQIRIEETGGELPPQIDLWMRIVESREDDRIVIPARPDATAPAGDSQIVVVDLLAGMMSGGGGSEGRLIWDLDSAQEKNQHTTVQLENQGAVLSGRYHLVAVSRDGVRYPMDQKHFLDFESLGRFQYAVMDLPPGEIAHLEVVPFRTRHKFFFNGVTVPEAQETKQVQTDDRPEGATDPKGIETVDGAEGESRSEGDEAAWRRSFEATLAKDPSYGEGAGQQASVKAWRELLEQHELPEDYRVFAWWRIGAQLSYNFASQAEESADYPAAAKAFEQARRVDPGLVSSETINATTAGKTLPGTDAEVARSLAEAYRWLSTRTDTMLKRSAKRINNTGLLIDKRYSPGGPPADTLKKRIELLRDLLTDAIEGMEQRITTELEHGTGSLPGVHAQLVEEAAKHADEEMVATWKALLKQTAEAEEKDSPTEPARPKRTLDSATRPNSSTRSDQPTDIGDAIPFDRFWPHGEFEGIALGDDREAVLEHWGKPRDTSTSQAMRIRTDFYPPDRRLLYHKNQLVRIRIGGGSFETRFNNGLDADLTRKRVLEELGAPDESSKNWLTYRRGDYVLEIVLDEERTAIQVAGGGPDLGKMERITPHHALMKLPDRKLDYKRFVQEGAVGPIALGDQKEEVVAKVGAPGDVRSMHGGRDWTHQYDNGMLEFRHGRLVSITLRLHGEAGVSFDNGLDGDTTMEQALSVMGQHANTRPPSGPHGTASFDVEQNIVSAYFMLEGQFFPESKEQAQTAPLTKLAVQRRRPETADRSETDAPVDQVLEKRLLGQWRGGGLLPALLKIAADGTFTQRSGGGAEVEPTVETGKWQLEGRRLTLRIDETITGRSQHKATRVRGIRIEGDTLVMEQVIDGAVTNTRWTYHRVDDQAENSTSADEAPEVDPAREDSSAAVDQGDVEFSPVTEVVLPTASGTKRFFTLDGERHASLPEERQALSVGFDPDQADELGHGLYLKFHDIHTIPVERDEGMALWRERTAEDHFHRAANFFGEVPFERYGLYSIESDKLPLTIDMTYRGLLQVMEMREGDAPTVTIRYKLLRQRTDEDSPSGSPRKNENVEPEQRSRVKKNTAFRSGSLSPD